MFANDTLVATLLQTFASSQRGFCDQIKQMDVNSKAFKTSVHALKGASGSLKATALHQLCVRMEQLDEAAKLDLLPTLCDELTMILASIDAAEWLVKES